VIAGWGNGGRRNGQRSIGLQRRMRNATHVPDLTEDEAAFSVDRLCHCSPTGDLLGAVQARRSPVALCLRRNISGLGNQQPAFARALAVILGVQCVGNIAGLSRTHPGHGGHDDAVLQFQGAKL
jgi:hypothetical protein